ncbi:MAG: cytochrome c maturation protein CcmE [Pseudomonadota bacterium]
MTVIKRHQLKFRRALIVTLALLAIVVGLCLILYNLKQNITFYLAPSEINSSIEPTKNIRLGGVIKPGSIKHNYLDREFVVGDNNAEVKVFYTGMLPSLFREGQGVIAEGKVSCSQNNCVMRATQILTKHDENYKPPMPEVGN